ncbi:triphosphoribosyl-dephospho-CoA synthase MdcB [Actimicrobium antarcticum]|uniref:triphosphoribosyl-dephospho-CoA synthase n=1 Tax=Actimicrobium antarcticum TaxID=1051899 RepID=A0ABP7SWK2_9BURK
MSALAKQSVLLRHAMCDWIAHLAVRSLHQELVLHPKPGLVTPFSNGSHRDMTAQTFMRSLFALRHYFKKITRAGADGAGFDALRELGIAAEQQMLVATRGVNTHRGAIFAIGMLCAALGALAVRQQPLDQAMLRRVLLQLWGADLQRHGMPAHEASNAPQIHAVRGARAEAMLGFPSVFEIGLPQLTATLAAGRGWHAACVDTLFALIARINDTNVLHRGGLDGAAMARALARKFMQEGGTGTSDWQARAADCNDQFVAMNLSPGGAADLLAATCLVYYAAHPQGHRP